MPATTIAAVRARRVFDSRGRPMRAPDGGVVYRSAQIANDVNLRSRQAAARVRGTSSYDEKLFHGATFSDLDRGTGPLTKNPRDRTLASYLWHRVANLCQIDGG